MLCSNQCPFLHKTKQTKATGEYKMLTTQFFEWLQRPCRSKRLVVVVGGVCILWCLYEEENGRMASDFKN